MMLMSAGIVAYASLEEAGGTFNLVLPAGGVKVRTDTQVKYNYNPTARINFTTCENNSQYPIYYRLRDASTNAEASELYKVSGTGVQYPAYKNGYGGYATGYYIMMQTDSSSPSMAVVVGSWEP